MTTTFNTKKAAGAFDIRNIIGALIGLYGLALLFSYLLLDPGINPDTGQPKDAVYNLWTGLALVATAVIFFAWAKLRPIVVPVEPDATPDTTPDTTLEADRRHD